VYLNYNTINCLPNNLYIDGHLDLSSTDITSLPDSTHVEGYLILFNTKIPKDRRVKFL